MSIHRDARIHNRPILILLLPAIMFLFAVGWLLYSLGELRRKPPTRAQAKYTPTKEDKIEIHIGMTEEPEEYNN